MIKNYISIFFLYFIIELKKIDTRSINFNSCDIVKKWVLQTFSSCESLSEIQCKHFFNEIQSLPSCLTLVTFVNILMKIWSFFFFNISILKCNQKVKANVLFFMSLLLGEFIFLDILNHFSSSNKSGNFENLIDVVGSMKERSLIENLNKLKDIPFLPE